MDTKKRGRRRFLKEGAALAGMAVGAIGSASAQTPESYPPTKTGAPMASAPVS